MDAKTGKREHAKQTLNKFSRRCPIISQARSVVEVIKGDKEAARETQKECLSTLGKLADITPVVGHISGVVHYATGDKARGKSALKKATFSTGVIIACIPGLASGGIPLAAVGGIETAHRLRELIFRDKGDDQSSVPSKSTIEETDEAKSDESSLEKTEEARRFESSIKKNDDGSIKLIMQEEKNLEVTIVNVQLLTRVRTLLTKSPMAMTVIQEIAYIIGLITRS